MKEIADTIAVLFVIALAVFVTGIVVSGCEGQRWREEAVQNGVAEWTVDQTNGAVGFKWRGK